MGLYLAYHKHSVQFKLKKVMAKEVMCDCELRRKMWVGQSKLKKLSYRLSSFQLQFAGIISLQFKFFASQV